MESNSFQPLTMGTSSVLTCHQDLLMGYGTEGFVGLFCFVFSVLFLVFCWFVFISITFALTSSESLSFQAKEK